MELLTNNAIDVEITTRDESHSLKPKRLNGFNKKIYVHSPSGTVIIGWIRKIFYADCHSKIEPFNDKNWRKTGADATNGISYDIHLISGELLFSSVYRNNSFVVEFDFLQRVVSEEEVRWLRESE
ncbi:MAG: hypothetical protein K0S32_1367 [Bacteroidetes bacterium]|jgi:hypothetical protein|nr:hypothetical protein [Bacteroidota bacterium]